MPMVRAKSAPFIDWIGLKSLLVRLFILLIFNAEGKIIKRYLFGIYINERWTGLKAHFWFELKTAIMCIDSVCVCRFSSIQFSFFVDVDGHAWNGVPYINHTCEYIIQTTVWHAFQFIWFALLWTIFFLSLSSSIQFKIKSCFIHVNKHIKRALNSSVDASFLCSNSAFPSFITFRIEYNGRFGKNAADRHRTLWILPFHKNIFIAQYQMKLKQFNFFRPFQESTALHFLHSSDGLCTIITVWLVIRIEKSARILCTFESET